MRGHQAYYFNYSPGYITGQSHTCQKYCLVEIEVLGLDMGLEISPDHKWVLSLLQPMVHFSNQQESLSPHYHNLALLRYACVNRMHRVDLVKSLFAVRESLLHLHKWHQPQLTNSSSVLGNWMTGGLVSFLLSSSNAS